MHEEKQQQIDEAIVEGYTRFPQTAADAKWAEASLRSSLESDPW